jgi:hypothetical protein
MSQLSWGKCTIEKATSTKGTPAEQWTAIDTPKEDTTKLTPTAGTEKTASEEGGDLVDSRTGKNTYQFEFELFVKKGGTRPFEDIDGLIAGEWAFRLTPEDEETEGFQIDRSTVRCEESYSTADGKMLKYVVKVLKPATGKSVKPYTKTASK